MADGVLVALADGGGIVSEHHTIGAFLALYLAVAACGGCAPQPVGPVVPDATADGGCQVLDAITASRLIRNPDGTSLVAHCDGGAL